MTSEERRAVTAFIGGISRVSGAASARTGHDLLVERNCLACHRRGNSPGLASQFPAIAEADPALRDALAALAPPALFGVGDKLRDDALSASITASTSRRRAWLRVQMPKFSLDADETRVLARHFIDSDRIPDRPADPRGDANVSQDHMATDAGVLAAGARLVTADGFGCTSCHAIGKWKPPSVALAAMGSDLSQIGGRIRHEWFDRWVRNPARIVPLMEMPAVVQPARGVLDGNLNAQLAAVWHVLDRPSFNPPNSSAMRVVRRANLPGIEEPAVVLTEVIDVDGRPFVKPLVIGLSNRHNVLVDLAHNRLAAWWIGDTARQQTRGKRWVWEAGVTGLLRIEKDADHLNASDMALVYSPRRIEPAADGDYVTQFDSFEHVAGGVRFAHRLGFRLEPKDEHPHTVRVKQQFSTLPPESGGAGAGFLRRVSFDAVPAGWQIELVALGGDVAVDPAGTTATLTGRGAALHVTLRSPTTARLTKSSRGAVVAMGNPAASSKEQAVACELEYRADVVADQFAPVAELDRSVPRAQLDVVPGFDAVRLPVTDQAMPTGLIWRADGTLVLSSLEGRVWLAHDTDGDGLEDKLVPFSDDLAAPFGVAAAGDSIDVINKYGLLRLTDRDGDGHADRTELLASGWGHTLDYHEWVVGLPRDRAGNYFVALACQQDERSEAGARMRGGVVKLAPREPTADDPRRFSLEQLCGGLRFPQGIALSPGDELFVTDNQGHYTPFNELNHVVPGARYGFINRLESQRGLNPPFQTAAIEIPHPWTRSVNGICFLETPAAAREKLGHELFGPLAGQMIGCEYDTRRLVRMSLERVAGEFQGAVYPLSIEPTAGGETFEGPLVCQISPGGDLYVGNIRDSGWGAGANTGSLVRLRWRGDLPCGIVEVRSQKNGFAISFTMAVDRRRAGQRDNYSVSSYRRIPTPDYGGPDRDRRVETVGSVAVSDDARQVAIELDDLREGFVYEFHVRDVGSGGLFFPAEAYYTLRHRVP